MDLKKIPQKDRHLAIASGDIQCAATFGGLVSPTFLADPLTMLRENWWLFAKYGFVKVSAIAGAELGSRTRRTMPRASAPSVYAASTRSRCVPPTVTATISTI